MSGLTLSPPPRVPRTSPKGGLYRGLGQLARELVLGWFGSWSGAGLELVWELVWSWFGSWLGAGLGTGWELDWRLAGRSL